VHATSPDIGVPVGFSWPSKHSVQLRVFLLLILYIAELFCPGRLPRMSLTTLDRMLVAAVREVALPFVWIPTGIKPKTAIKQKAATPRARVSSTSEKAAPGDSFFIVGRF
jgi:hypothetical protein